MQKYWFSYKKKYKNCKSIIREKRKKLNRIVLLAKTKLNNIEILIFREILIFKALIDSYITHDQFVLVNVLKEYDDVKDKYRYING